MKVNIKFDLEIEGKITENDAKKLFWERFELPTYVITDNENTFAIIVNGFEFKDEVEIGAVIEIE